MKTIIQTRKQSESQTPGNWKAVDFGAKNTVWVGGRSYEQLCYLDLEAQRGTGWRLKKFAGALLLSICSAGIAPMLSVRCRGLWVEALEGKRVVFHLVETKADPVQARKALDFLAWNKYFNPFLGLYRLQLEKFSQLFSAADPELREIVSAELSQLKAYSTSCTSYELQVQALKDISSRYKLLAAAYRKHKGSLDKDSQDAAKKLFKLVVRAHTTASRGLRQDCQLQYHRERLG